MATCPSCGHMQARYLLSLEGGPVTVASAFPSAEMARAVAGGPVELLGCTACGLLYNEAFDPALAAASGLYESSQAASAHFNAFSKELAAGWVERHGLRGQHIVEVGFGGGDFIVDMLKAGCASATGIDPLAAHAVFDAQWLSRVKVEASCFEAPHTRLPAAALVCRHSLEHIADVRPFLTRVAQWSRHNGGAPVLFEVPAAERIIDECAFWDIFYEHCNYFSLASLRHAFEGAGLEVFDLRAAYGQQYLLVDARARAGDAPPARPPQANDAQPWIASCVAFAEQAQLTIDRCRAHLSALAGDPGGVVIWQGASKTVGLVTAIGESVPLRFAVDQNTGRHGKFLPPNGMLVAPPESLREARPSHVVLMNPVYFAEVRAQLDNMGLAGARLHTIDSLAASAASRA